MLKGCLTNVDYGYRTGLVKEGAQNNQKAQTIVAEPESRSAPCSLKAGKRSLNIRYNRRKELACLTSKPA